MTSKIGGGGDADQALSSVEAPDFVDTSEFFNSKGELQISGMSQCPSESDSNASTSYAEISQRQDTPTPATQADTKEEKGSSQNASQNSKAAISTPTNDFSITDLVEKRASNSSASSSCSHGKSKGGKKCKDKKCGSKPAASQPLAQLNTDNFQGFVHMLPKHLQPQPGMLSQRFSPTSASSPSRQRQPLPIGIGTQRQTPPFPNPFGLNPSPGFAVRAPNFRLKSSEDEIKDPPHGILSDAEIRDATRRLYEMDRAERELEGQQNQGTSANKPPASPASVIRNLFNSSNPTPAHLLPSPESLAIPTLNDGLDELMNYYIHKYKVRPPAPTPNSQPQPPSAPGPSAASAAGASVVEVDEPQVVKSKAFVCGDQAKTNEAAAETIARCLPQRQTQNKNLSPLPKSPKSRAVNLKELDQLWKDIQETKAKMDQDIQARLQQQNSNVPQLLNAVSPSKDAGPCSSKTIAAQSQPNPARGKQQPRSRGKRVAKKKPKSKPNNTSTSVTSSQSQAAGDSKSNDASGSGAGHGNFNPIIKAGLEQSSELSTLLQMAQLDESTLLEDLLLDDMHDLDYTEFDDYQIPPEDEEQEDNNGKKEGEGTETGNNEEDDEEACDSELIAALENVQLRDWLRSDPQHVVYYEKYCQEKYKREYCEKEILDLQKQLLETKERVAGLDGILQVKTKSGVRYQKLWEGMIKKWKQHEAECASKIDKLEKQNTELSKTVETQLTKTKEYEDELNKTVGLVEEFKERMEGMRRQFDAELLDWKCKMGFVQQDLNTAQGSLQQEKKEKESVKKALDQAQGTVQKLETENKNTVVKLQVTEQKLKSNNAQIEQLNQTKEQLAAEVEKEREEKQVLERRLRAESKEEMKKEGERLHTYYNDKVREILKAESEKMRDAETEFIKSHELELKSVTEKYEDQIQEMKNHFENQISNLKLYYKMEITKLEKESQEKGKLIENVSRELALFLNQDSNANQNQRLQSNGSASNLIPGHHAPMTARIENNFAAQSQPQPRGEAQNQNQPPLQRKRNNSKECNIAAAAATATNTEKSSPNSLRDLLESNQGMKASIASLINAYKDKHNNN